MTDTHMSYMSRGYCVDVLLKLCAYQCTGKAHCIYCMHTRGKVASAPKRAVSGVYTRS